MPTLSDEIADPAVWRAVVDEVTQRRPGDQPLIDRYGAMLADGTAARLAADVVQRRHRPRPAQRRLINKAGRRKKVVFVLEPPDELLFRVLNRLLQPRVDPDISPRCHSFRPRHGVISAFRSVQATPAIDDCAALHLDISDFFNSIDVDDLLERLPHSVVGDDVVMAVVEPVLRERRARGRGGLVDAWPKGVMAGTPLAPLLTNLYLRDVDDAVASTGVASARYSDDILVLGGLDAVDAVEVLLRRLLCARGLSVNEEKTRRSAPGEPWEFLGLRYDRGSVGLSDNTRRKLEDRVRRRARRLLAHRLDSGSDPAAVARLFCQSLNRKLYGVAARGGDEFCWSTWFFPLLTTSGQLAELDRFVQREVRYAATGSRRDRARGEFTYAQLREAGYLPLMTAYAAHRRQPGELDAVLAARCRQGGAGVLAAAL